MKQTLSLIAIIIIFVISGAAQRNSQTSVSTPIAQKFGVVEYVCGTELSMRIASFVKILRKQPSAKAYIIIYPNPQLENAHYLISNSKLELKEAKIAPNRIIFLEGGFRGEYTTAEFFIVPKGAVPPVPIPTLEEKEITLKP